MFYEDDTATILFFFLMQLAVGVEKVKLMSECQKCCFEFITIMYSDSARHNSFG